MKNKKVCSLFISGILALGCLFPFIGCNSQGTPTDDNAVIELQLLNNHKNESIDELFTYAQTKTDENYYSESSRALILDILKKSPLYLGGMAQWSETFMAIVIMCIIPSAFMVLAIFFGIISLVKAMTIVVAAYYNFVIANGKKGKDA